MKPPRDNKAQRALPVPFPCYLVLFEASRIMISLVLLANTRSSLRHQLLPGLLEQLRWSDAQ